MPDPGDAIAARVAERQQQASVPERGRPDPIRVTPQMFRDIIEQFGFMPGVDVEWQWLTAAADRIEALEELLREALADPDTNWKTAWADAVREALDA